MKQCPACRRQFPDDLQFCLEDGSPLIGAADEVETQFARIPTASKRGGSGWLTGLLALALFLIAGIALAAAGIGGYLYYSSTKSGDDSKPPTSPTPTKPTPYPSPTASISQTATPRRSPTASPTPTISDPMTVDPSKEDGKKPPVPKQISGGVLNGKATSLPKPPYPPAARAVRASGSVAVQVLVDENGSVISASAVSGHPLLRAAAVSAARAARFNPTILSGQPVKVSGVITYNFVPPE